MPVSQLAGQESQAVPHILYFGNLNRYKVVRNFIE